MIIRVVTRARLALLLLVSLTMSVVGTSAFSGDHFTDTPQHETHALQASPDEVVHTTGHDHHSLPGVERHSGHHDDHVGECHTNLCCVMDCHNVINGFDGATELSSQPSQFAIIVRASREQLVPDRPPRTS